MRKPNNVETFNLGHWEAMVISVALRHYSENPPEGVTLSEVRAANDFSHIFGTGEATYSIVKEFTGE